MADEHKDETAISDTVKLWQKRLDKEKEAHEDFRKQAKEAEKAARDDGDKKNAFNIHWTNCQITRAAVYASVPSPDVRRRFQKPDPEEKELARMVERGLEYMVDVGDFDAQSNAVVKDYVETGLGVPRVVYNVQTEELPDEVDPQMAEIAELMGVEIPETFDQGNMEIVDQGLSIEHVPWSRFRWEPGKAWKHIQWISYDSMQPRKEVEKEFDVRLNASTGGDSKDQKDRKANKYVEEVLIHEIWNKRTRKIIVIAEGHPDVLEERDDDLSLVGFYPSPMPLFMNLKSDELIPKPDYELVKKQIVELNSVTQRIDRITRQIKDVSFYDPKISQGLSALVTAKDGALVPVTNLAASLASSTGKSDFDNTIAHLPMQEKIMVVRELEAQREAIKAQIYELLGISDIIRGSSKASETAAAQNLKGQWAGVRLSEKTGNVARIWRDTFRIMAEVMCEHFEPEQLQLMTGIEVTDRMQEIMMNDVGRTFAIDIETDSTIAKDDQEDRAATMEMIEIVGAKLEQLIPAVQQGAIPLELMQEILVLIVGTHKHGKQLEDAIMGLGEHVQQGIGQQMQQLQQQIQEMGQQLQQAQGQAEQMHKELQQYSEREENRKDTEAEAKIIDAQADNVRQDEASAAEIELKAAQTIKTYVDAGVSAREPEVETGHEMYDY